MPDPGAEAISSVLVLPDGRLRFVYADELAALLGAGTAQVRRVSHVEPTPAGEWTADLTPVDGPVLGPYPLRRDALRAEREWLEKRLAEVSP